MEGWANAGSDPGGGRAADAMSSCADSDVGSAHEGRLGEMGMVKKPGVDDRNELTLLVALAHAPKDFNFTFPRYACLLHISYHFVLTGPCAETISRILQRPVRPIH